MRVTLIGFGCGTPELLTQEGRRALEHAQLLLGAPRLMDTLEAQEGQRRVPLVRPEEQLAFLEEAEAEEVCILYSGDSGFFSGVRGITPLLRRQGIDYRILPGISSVQLLSARLGRAWQDWGLFSAHGVDCDPVTAVMAGRPAFFLTGGRNSPQKLCLELTEAGLGALPVVVGERLSYPDERIVEGTAQALSEGQFAPLSVLLAEPAPVSQRRAGGFPDEAFLRGEVPMTKQEVRAAALSKLAVRPEDTVWDIGAGTGSVSVELALAARQGRCYAVEREEAACALVRRNRERFGAWNLVLVCGQAPEALARLPAPEAVFLGGSGGHLDEIVAAVWEKNPDARLCVSAIALETLSAAVTALTRGGRRAEVTQVAVSRSRSAGGLHLMAANNPVFLITA